MASRDEDPTQTELQRAYAAYRAAMTNWRATCEVGRAEADERAADRLLHARVDLYRSLLATGWEPPPAVGVQLERDAALAAAPHDFEAILGV